MERFWRRWYRLGLAAQVLEEMVEVRVSSTGGERELQLEAKVPSFWVVPGGPVFYTANAGAQV